MELTWGKRMLKAALSKNQKDATIGSQQPAEEKVLGWLESNVSLIYHLKFYTQCLLFMKNEFCHYVIVTKK